VLLGAGVLGAALGVLVAVPVEPVLDDAPELLAAALEPVSDDEDALLSLASGLASAAVVPGATSAVLAPPLLLLRKSVTYPPEPLS
jgi:hypothetical protein